jgi:hypothetical protein
MPMKLICRSEAVLALGVEGGGELGVGGVLLCEGVDFTNLLLSF